MSACSLLVAVDPSLRGCGVAFFADGELLAAGVRRTTLVGAPAWLDVASRVRSFVDEVQITAFAGRVFQTVDQLVIEVPQKDARPARVSDLLDLAGVAGAVAARIWARHVDAPTPTRWKGSVPKNVVAERARGALRPGEHWIRIRDVDSLAGTIRHNAWDAIALGLWALGRLPSARSAPDGVPSGPRGASWSAPGASPGGTGAPPAGGRRGRGAPG
jgi:hypothetical protein